MLDLYSPFKFYVFLQKGKVMKKVLLLFKYLSFSMQFLLLFFEGVTICLNQKKQIGMVTALIILALLLLVIIAIYKFIEKLDRRNSALFIIIQIIICTILLFLVGDGYIQMYYFFVLDSIFDEETEKRHLLIAIHFIAIIFAVSARILINGNKLLPEALANIAYFCAVYGMVLVIFLMVHYFKDEQQRLQKLNADMIEYSFGERRYLIEKERNNISQELHDTIGHSLMAVLLNVRYLKAIKDKPQEMKDIQIDEIEKLLTECTASLRKSVTNLREVEENLNLKEEIERVTEKFNHLGFIKITFDYDQMVDKASKNIKSAIYKTIQESITNSIHHGNASKINILINLSHKQINLLIKDNGIGCTDIQKSYGLKGIEERFKKLSGEVEFISSKNKGFTIQAVIPERIEK